MGRSLTEISESSSKRSTELEEERIKIIQLDEAATIGRGIGLRASLNSKLEPIYREGFLEDPIIPLVLQQLVVRTYIQLCILQELFSSQVTMLCQSLDLLTFILMLHISAICPYLALETCRQWRLSNKTVNLMRNGKMPTVTIEQAQRNFIKV